MAEPPDNGHWGPESEYALRHCWDWFVLHSGQRMQMLNFYFVVLALLTSAYATLLSAHRDTVGGAIALVGVLISVVFNALDARTRELISAAEAPMASLELILSARVGRDVNLVTSRQRGHRKSPSYRQIVNALSLVTFGGFFVAAVTAFIH